MCWQKRSKLQIYSGHTLRWHVLYCLIWILFWTLYLEVWLSKRYKSFPSHIKLFQKMPIKVQDYRHVKTALESIYCRFDPLKVFALTSQETKGHKASIDSRMSGIGAVALWSRVEYTFIELFLIILPIRVTMLAICHQAGPNITSIQNFLML